MRSLVILLFIFSFLCLSHAFYPNLYLAAPYKYIEGQYPDEFRGRALTGRIRSGGRMDSLQKMSNTNQASVDKVKRFRPCFYSPIQCLIKRK
ncbi:unnamed protein product, partial [Mesorhabditis belari]|uniref:Neuropeptide-Like Protein n=1 Tax=Mesorhabditis belari TaxID=2138241 RepID=A0AAF3JB99_9BILA